MQAPSSHSSVLPLLILLVRCNGADRTEPRDPATTVVADAGPDAGDGGCPEPDGGRIQVTRRGCPVTLEIGIH